MSRDVSNRVYREAGVTTGFHIASHHQERDERILEFAKINRYHVGLLPYFLDKLKKTADGESNLLDNSLIVYGSPMGNSNVHNHKRCPLLFAGHARRQAQGQPAPQGRRRHADGQRHVVGAADGRPRDRAVWRQHGSARFERGRRLATTVCRSQRMHDASCVARDSSRAYRRLCGDGRRSSAQSPAASAPVADAAQARDRRAVRALLKQGADVNAAQGDGMTALHWAAMNGDAELDDDAALRRRQRAGDDAARRLYAAASGGAVGLGRRHRAAARARRAGDQAHGDRRDAADAGRRVGQCAPR